MECDKLLFSEEEHAEGYAKYRPDYPQELHAAIVNFCQDKSKGSVLDLAIDIGCGSGQSTLALAGSIKHVVGIDVSAAQINQARRLYTESHKNVEFQVGPAEDLSQFKDSSVDLVTFATCFHWLDAEKVYAEVKRVLKPGGVIAVFAKGLVYASLDEVTSVIKKFNYQTLADYWSPRICLIWEQYQDIMLPFEDFTRDETSFKIHRQYPLSMLIGYLRSWSGYQNYMKAHPEDDILLDVEMNIRNIYQKHSGSEDHDVLVDMTWPMYLLMGRK